jgi:16S rRNA G966 N2-methylase RsmD
MVAMKQSMPHLYEVKNYKGICIKDKWTPDVLQKVLRVNRKSHSTPYMSEIIRQIGFTSGCSKVTMYRPLLTKRIVQTFGAKHVLDVCVGWGGRMVGSVAVDGVSYTGIEPNTKTFHGLKQIQETIGIKDDRITLFHDTAETVLPTLTRTYDLAITSPPYYNLELYSDEISQSHHYGSYQQWVQKFLQPVVWGVLAVLTKGGKSCWSVKNFKTDKQYNLQDDILRLHKEKGWTLMDREFYVGNSVRPGSHTQGKEITFVFTKE